MKLLQQNSRWAVVALLCASANGQNASDAPTGSNTNEVVSNNSTVVEVDPCHVCGEGGAIGSGSTMISTPLGMYTCGGLQGAGLAGNIDKNQCPTAQRIAVTQCGCEAADGTMLTEEHLYKCNICSDDKSVTIFDGIIEIPSQSNRTCEEYMEAAANGVIQESQCGLLQQFTSETCGCKSNVAPTLPPANAPLSSPTLQTCELCGEGMTVTALDAIVALPNQQERTCADLIGSARSGAIPIEECGVLRPFVEESCRCSLAKTIAPTPTPGFSCNICGDGMKVTIPEGVVQIATQPNRTCSQLLEANEIGNIHEMQCTLLQPFVTVPCGCEPVEYTFEPSSMPSDAPSLVPTKAPAEPTISPAPSTYSTMRDGCFSDLGEILALEKQVRNTNDRRKYILCPDTTFDMGIVDSEGFISEGQPFIMLRPNVIYQCGEDGSKNNNCVLKGGDFAVTSFYGVIDGIYETVENVKLIGLTFKSQNLVGAVLEAAGDITFKDCVFRDHGNMVPVLMQWRGDAPEDQPQASRRLRNSNEPSASRLFYERVRKGGPSEREIEQTLASRKLQEDNGLSHLVFFQDCVFRDNYITTTMGFPGIVENTFGSELKIVNCLFEDNEYDEENNPAPFGYAIRSYGPLHIQNSCFLNNSFHHHAPVLVFSAPHTESNNFLSSSRQERKLSCDFVALFTTQDSLTNESPICFESDAEQCAFTQEPTRAPTKAPRGSHNQGPGSKEDPAKPKTGENTKSSAPSRSSRYSIYLVSCISVILLWDNRR